MLSVVAFPSLHGRTFIMSPKFSERSKTVFTINAISLADASKTLC